MIENILLVGGPLDGQKHACSGGNMLLLTPRESGPARLVYRRAHAESKFFHFLPEQTA